MNRTNPIQTDLKRRQVGFTLTELLISTILISIMAVTIGVTMFRAQERTRQTRTTLVRLQTQNGILDAMSEELRWAHTIRSLDTTSINFIVSNAGPNMDTITITPRVDFSYSSTYDCWRITWHNGGFDGTFTAATSGTHTLKVTHLSSYAAGAPGNGCSPVTIWVNGNVVVANYDPASNHSGSHNWVTDSWTINTNQGENTFRWSADYLYTQYWIQRLEFIRESKAYSVYADFTVNPILTGATDAASETIDYAWKNITHTLERSVNGQAAVTVLEDVCLFDLQPCDFGWDNQNQRYLRSIKIAFQIGPDVSGACERYVHLVNYPYW